MNFKRLLAYLAMAPLIAACAQNATPSPDKKASGLTEPQVMCTQDARQCPDGSWAGRSGPKCEFKCPAAR